MINHPRRKKSPILDVVREFVGSRHRINHNEMSAILADLANRNLVELHNNWGGSSGMPEDTPAAELARRWAGCCQGITVISVLADDDPAEPRLASSNPGSIRFDDPGSMHPLLRATVMFAPERVGEDSVQWLRARASRVLVVTGEPVDPDDAAAQMEEI